MIAPSFQPKGVPAKAAPPPLAANQLPTAQFGRAISAFRVGADLVGCGHDLFVPHRDDYYLLMLVTQGALRLQLDFREAHVVAPAFLLVQPGQVRHLTHLDQAEGFFVGFYPTQLRPELDPVLAQPLSSSPTVAGAVPPAVLLAATLLVDILAGPTTAHAQPAAQAALATLLTLCAGLTSPDPTAPPGLRRAALIEQAFIRLVQVQYTAWKKPAAYAQALALTPAHLNDVLQTTTGQSTTEHIQQRVVLEAKRRLAFTERSVKEISYELGYDDPNYFTRLFRKLTQSSPGEFRTRFRDSCY